MGRALDEPAACAEGRYRNATNVHTARDWTEIRVTAARAARRAAEWDNVAQIQTRRRASGRAWTCATLSHSSAGLSAGVRAAVDHEPPFVLRCLRCLRCSVCELRFLRPLRLLNAP